MGSLLPQLAIMKGAVLPQIRPNLLHDLFDLAAGSRRKMNENAETDNGKIALIFDVDDGTTRTFSYAEMNYLSDVFAAEILRTVRERPTEFLPNSDGDYIIAVHMQPSDYLIIVLLAILKCGAQYLPLDCAYPTGRIQHIMRDARPILVIHDYDEVIESNYLEVTRISLRDLIESDSGTMYNNSNCRQWNRELIHQLLRNEASDIAIVLYTSGSTGIPKGVRLSHKSILNRLQWQFHRFPYASASENVCIFKTSLTFVDSICEIWGPLISGRTLYILANGVTKNPEKLVEILDNYKIERLVLVPTLLRNILIFVKSKKKQNIVGKPLENLKLWICSGEALTKSLVEEFYQYFECHKYVLCNFYGSTEVMGDVTYHAMQSYEEVKFLNSVPIGLPIDNATIFILDDQFKPVKLGEIGELYVSGENLASGYVCRRENNTKFLEKVLISSDFSEATRLYRTGDYASIENGTILYQGRTDSQIKIRGQRVDLTEIEVAFQRMSSIDKCVVLCYKPGEINQELLAFVTLTADSSSTTETCIEQVLKESLTSYMVPRVVLIEQFPLLVNGKIDRQTLLKSYEMKHIDTNNNLNEFCFDYTGVDLKQMDAAKALFEIVNCVLGTALRTPLNLQSNFYEVGGNSLNSIVVIMKLAQIGYQISIHDFIHATNFNEILWKMCQKISYVNSSQTNSQYSIEYLRDEHKESVIKIITVSFYEKADLEQWLIPDISKADYTELLQQLWLPLVEKQLSFVVKTIDQQKVIAVALNFDAHDEPAASVTSKLNVIFEFLESLEGPIRDNELPVGKGHILHSFMMGTHSSLASNENVAVMNAMEEEIVKLAKRRQFTGILTTNTNPLTQQLGSDVYGYESLLDYQVNEFIAEDGSRPFGLAPDSQRAIVHWKPVKRYE